MPISRWVCLSVLLLVILPVATRADYMTSRRPSKPVSAPVGVNLSSVFDKSPVTLALPNWGVYSRVPLATYTKPGSTPTLTAINIGSYPQNIGFSERKAGLKKDKDKDDDGDDDDRGGKKKATAMPEPSTAAALAIGLALLAFKLRRRR
jgi:hypothetical protein